MLRVSPIIDVPLFASLFVCLCLAPRGILIIEIRPGVDGVSIFGFTGHVIQQGLRHATPIKGASFSPPLSSLAEFVMIPSAQLLLQAIALLNAVHPPLNGNYICWHWFALPSIEAGSRSQTVRLARMSCKKKITQSG